MANINDTAYPRFKDNISGKDLINIYTPAPIEILFANEVTRSHKNRLIFLILLKTYQRLGYFVNLTEIPKVITSHIAGTLNIDNDIKNFEKYDTSTVRLKHVEYIRNHLGTKAFDNDAKEISIKTAAEAARTKDNNADIINTIIDELI